MTETRNKQIATLKAWAKALRSGKYEQAHAELRTGDTNTMCCLGVLCDVVAPRNWEGDAHTGLRGNELDCGYAPQTVLQTASLSADDATLLATLNDEGEAGFEEIADVVDWMRYDLEARK